MDSTTERLAWIRLALMPYIGAESFARLLAHYGSAAAVWAAEDEVAAVLPTQAARAAWRTRQHEAEAAAETACRWAEQENCALLLSCDAGFPAMLGEGLTPPPLLFVRGNPRLLSSSSVAVVGSRHATPQGMRIAADFGAALAEQGLVTVSGMAAGIDTAAHEGALRQGGGTVAVWGTGIDRVYPTGNKVLAHRIAEHGCIISEFPLGTRPLAANFPRRNRLIAALAQGVLVVEAAVESGSLITARLAAEMGREVFAVPGSIDNPHSKGCHALIKQGAKLTESLADILEECPLLVEPPLLPEEAEGQVASAPQRQPVKVADDPPAAAVETDNALLAAMGYAPVHPDTLAQTLGIPAADVYAEITLLEIEGRVAPLPGGRYQRV